MPSGRVSQLCRLRRVAGCSIIGVERTNSAHLHRPWRAIIPNDLTLPAGVSRCVKCCVNTTPSIVFHKLHAGWSLRAPAALRKGVALAFYRPPKGDERVAATRNRVTVLDGRPS